MRALRALSVPAMMAARRYSIEPVQKWGSWADEIWEQFQDRCSFGVVRDSSTLDMLYPLGSGRILAWVVKKAGRPVGWTTGLNTQMRDHKYLEVLGWDGARLCSAPEAAGSVAWLSARMLARAGADVVLTNQQHLLWRNAFRQAGFFPGPSNYLLAISKRLSEQAAQGGGLDAIHLTRGDGDGRINL